MLGLEGKSEKKNLPTETGYFRGFALQLKKKRKSEVQVTGVNMLHSE